MDEIYNKDNDSRKVNEYIHIGGERPTVCVGRLIVNNHISYNFYYVNCTYSIFCGN